MDQNSWTYFADALWADLPEAAEYYSCKPLLAHYTSIASIEKILGSNELWFANPLYMNDLEEVRFGIQQGFNVVTRSDEIANACGDHNRFQIFLRAFEESFNRFANDHAADTYVFCMSEHSPQDNDGILSMWRGYGGNGSGVALVIDAGKIDRPEDSALILAKVHYGTAAERIDWLRQKAQLCAELIHNSTLPLEGLCDGARVLFERIKMFALYSKHRGFDEEREWRIVYTPSHDQKGALKDCFHYLVGARGIEPRLRFRIAPKEGVTAQDLSLEKITDRIILGPTTSSPLALSAFHRLLESKGHPELKGRVRASGIPFRS